MRRPGEEWNGSLPGPEETGQQTIQERWPLRRFADFVLFCKPAEEKV